jgi:hypothetical protein
VKSGGGGRGTGFEPSSRRPTWKKVAQRMAPVTAAQSRGRLEAEAQKGRQPALPWGPNTAPVSDCVHPENHDASSFRPPLLVIAEDRAAYANHQNEGGARDQCTRRVPSRKRRNKQEKRREQLGSRVQPLKQHDTAQIPVHATFASHTNLKIPEPCRPWSLFGPIRHAECALGSGALWMTMTIKTAGPAPLLRHSSGEYHNGGAGTSK